MFMKRLYNILLLLELLGLVLFPIVTWAMSMMGSDVVNIFSEDSLRWIFLHFGEMLIPRCFAPIMFFLIALGVWQQPGLRDIKFKGNRFIVYFITYLLLYLLVRWPAIFGYTPLLGIDGSEIPSPWFLFSPYVLAFCIVWLAMMYAYYTGVACTLDSQIELIKKGARQHSPWLLVVMIGNLLLSIVTYALKL